MILHAGKMQYLKKVFYRLLNKRFIFSLFIFLAIAAACKEYLNGTYNNYLIFKSVFEHTWDRLNLYDQYPAEYFDSNHYGPAFSLLIAPFALLPDFAGMLLWNIANAIILCIGIYSLPVSDRNRALIGMICSHEALTALLSFQFNVALTGMILLSFSWLVKQQEFKSALMIVIGALVKLYGIVGLAFFFFCKRKARFVLSCIFLFLVLFFSPAIFSDVGFTLNAYADWYHSLVHKNTQNIILGSIQDISLMGMARRISGNTSLPNSIFLAGGILLSAVPFARTSQYKYLSFRLMLLASVLIFTVIFSSGSESPTYIIAMTGVAIWYIQQPSPKKGWALFLFVFAMLLTSFSPSDLFPRYIRKTYVIPYSLKALPCVLIWLEINAGIPMINRMHMLLGRLKKDDFRFLTFSEFLGLLS